MTDTDWPFADQEELARRSECFETPEWAAQAILERELLTPSVLDPCCGRGVLAQVAEAAGYVVAAIDLNDWGFGETGLNFLSRTGPDVGRLFGFQRPPVPEFSVFMNPPFSYAEEFVEHALELGARKIVSFQRFAWWESVERLGFWERHRPARVYVTASRADCWRVDISPAERAERGGTPTAHAWFIWEDGHPATAALGHLTRPRGLTLL